MDDSRPRRRRPEITLAAVTVFATPACAVGSSGAPADQELIEAMAWQEPGEIGTAACPPLHENLRSLGELLPNTRFRGPDGTERGLAEAVVVGRFTGVEPGQGMVTPEPDGPSDLPVAFDDPDALYRTVHARFAVEAVVAGEVPGDPVSVGFQVDGAGSDDNRFPGLDEVEQGLPALGRVVLFLDGFVFSDDPAVLGVVDHFLGRLGSGNRLDLPLLPAEHAERLLASIPALEDLERAAAGPAETVDVGVCLERPPGTP